LKVLFATLDLKLNNSIIDKLGLSEDALLEVESIEEVEEKAWDFSPSMVIIGDGIESATGSKIEPLIYKTITALKDTFDTVYVTDRKGDPLIRRLLDKGFFKFSSVNAPLDTPKNLKQAEETIMRDIDIPGGASTGERVIDLPTHKKSQHKVQYVDESRSIVTAVWSPIPNVGANTFARSLAYTLAKYGRKTLLIELDWEYPKLSRATALTHGERNLKTLIKNMGRLGKDLDIEDFLVNAKIAEDDLPHTHKQAKQKLKKLPLNLYVLCREATSHYEEEPEISDERAVDRLLFECKRAGFQHIVVDLPSNPNNIFTMLTLLVADERLAVVDDAFSTSGFYKMSMQAFETINLNSDNFELVINKTRPVLTAHDIAEFYDKTPSLSMPHCDQMCLHQLELDIAGSDDYMKPISSFARRYGLNIEEQAKEKKGFRLFVK
jgi:Mrp family chromosome partitioning ATPase